MRTSNILLIAPLFFFLLGQEFASTDVIASGKSVYEQRCAVCHGIEGKGDGPAQQFLYPKPRDLTAGKFKIRSTPSLPTDDDLLRIISDGIPGTAMPGWAALPMRERKDIVAYVKSLSPVFSQQPEPKPVRIPPTAKVTPALLELGKKFYMEAECLKCHGATGKGDGEAAGTLKDEWGYPILPYDFTIAGRMKGGNTVRDVYRTLVTGIGGTPMPSYADSLSAQEMWGLAYYVQSLSKRPTGPAPKEEATITSKFIKVDLSAPDPTSPIWKKAPAMDVLLRPLWFKEGYVDRVRVRSLHNGKEIAILLEWEDPTKNADVEKLEPPRLVLARALKSDHTKSADIPRLEAFGDAVALQFPVKANGLPPFPMGEAGQVVNIWQWRIDREGNGRGSVENLAAAGFGTLTSQLSQDVKGKGIWSKGKWRIVFSRVMTGGGEVVGLAPGKVMPVAFAVWNGAINQRDGEKSVSTWAFLKIERPTQ